VKRARNGGRGGRETKAERQLAPRGCEGHEETVSKKKKNKFPPRGGDLDLRKAPRPKRERGGHGKPSLGGGETGKKNRRYGRAVFVQIKNKMKKSAGAVKRLLLMRK